MNLATDIKMGSTRVWGREVTWSEKVPESRARVAFALALALSVLLGMEPKDFRHARLVFYHEFHPLLSLTHFVVVVVLR